MDKKAAKMLYLQSQQQEIVTLNVGGSLFQSTKTTLQADPSFILACILSNCKHRPWGKNYDFFLDRNPKHYGFILDYLRNNCKIIPSAFPRDVSTLKEICNEANFLDLDELSSTPEWMESSKSCARPITDFIRFHANFLQDFVDKSFTDGLVNLLNIKWLYVCFTAKSLVMSYY